MDSCDEDGDNLAIQIIPNNNNNHVGEDGNPSELEIATQMQQHVKLRKSAKMQRHQRCFDSYRNLADKITHRRNADLMKLLFDKRNHLTQNRNTHKWHNFKNRFYFGVCPNMQEILFPFESNYKKNVCFTHCVTHKLYVVSTAYIIYAVGCVNIYN